MEYNGDVFDVPSERVGELDGKEGEKNSFSDGSFIDYTDKTSDGKNLCEEDRYDEIFDTSKRNTRAFSVISMILGIISLVCCCIGPLGFVLGVGAIVFSIISRKSLGYFDGFSVVGLILGIFGACFGAVVFILIFFTGIFDSIMSAF